MIIREDKSNGNFTQISNDIVRRSDMSTSAKAVMLYCLSQKDDWIFFAKEITSHFTDLKKDKMTKVLKELKALGYIEINQKREKGQFKDYDWIIREVPKINMSTESGFADSGKMPPRRRTTSNNTKKEDLKDNSQGGANAPTVLLGSSSIGKEMINLYFSTYKIRFGKEHAKLSKGRENTIIKYISMISSTFGIEMENWENMIKYYMYKSKFSINVDYNINHFTSYGMLNVYLEREFKTPILDPTYSI